MTRRNGTSSITAEALRPLRVDESGAPDLVTGDAPEGTAPAVGSTSSAPASTGNFPTHSTPAPAPITSSTPTPTPDPPPAPTPAPPDPPSGPAGVTTAEIVAALGLAHSAQVHVTAEPSPYIEGGRIVEGRGFFADLYAAGARGDGEAGRRAAQFQAQLRDYIAAANNDQANSPQIIPPAWGGAWFVEQIAMLRPSVSAFSSATITDARPIPVPGFKDTTPSSLVADHVEGTPDTAGTVNFLQITVTPRAKSGRAEITRELLDSSPALADRVVSGALRESYSESCESTMCGVLEAGATAGPAGGADAAALELAIRQGLGAFPGSRFLTGRVVLPSAAHWSALVGANDATGRPLLPYVGYNPTNVGGAMGTGYGEGSIAGVPARPAWALNPDTTILGAGPSDAMSFESSLLEFRFSEKSGPELVEFNVWGYFGAVVLQPKGVLKVTSTASGFLVAPNGNGNGNGAGNGEGEPAKARSGK